MLAYHTTSNRSAALIAKSGFRVPQRASHSATDAAGMGGSFFRAVFVTKKKPSPRASGAHASLPYGPALITVRLRGKYIPWQQRPDELFVDALYRHIRAAKRLSVAGIDTGRDDYGVLVVDPRAIQIVRVEYDKYPSW